MRSAIIIAAVASLTIGSAFAQPATSPVTPDPGKAALPHIDLTLKPANPAIKTTEGNNPGAPVDRREQLHPSPGQISHRSQRLQERLCSEEGRQGHLARHSRQEMTTATRTACRSMSASIIRATSSPTDRLSNSALERATPMKVTITRLYDDYASAREAVMDVEAMGLSSKDISLIANNAPSLRRHAQEDQTRPRRQWRGRSR
jgi:hypothetical protein